MVERDPAIYSVIVYDNRNLPLVRPTPPPSSGHASSVSRPVHELPSSPRSDYAVAWLAERCTWCRSGCWEARCSVARSLVAGSNRTTGLRYRWSVQRSRSLRTRRSRQLRAAIRVAYSSRNSCHAVVAALSRDSLASSAVNQTQILLHGRRKLAE